MSYEQRKINRQKREKKYKTIIISIAIILLIIILSSLFSKNIKTVLPIEEVFLKEIELQATLIKNEKVFKLTESKDIDKDILEGKRIPIGTKVGSSTLLNDLKILKDELKEVETAITTLEKSNKDTVFKNDKENLIENYNDEIEKLQESIYTEDYKLINTFKDEIILIDKNINDLIPQGNLLGQSTESLKEKREELKKEINYTDSSYISKMSGILSYEIDGYENIYKAQKFENYTYDNLSTTNEEIKSLDKTKGSKDIKGFKIIDNFEWYLAIKIDNRKDIPNYSVGDNLYVNYPLKDGEFELAGDIVSINNSSNKSVIILRFNKYLHDFYNDRFSKVKLIQEKHEAFKIPNAVILDEDGQKGVYIKNFSGIVKFRPINIIATKGDYTYIDKGKNGLISIGKNKKDVKKESTVSIYDEILLKPHKFKKGQIIE